MSANSGVRATAQVRAAVEWGIAGEGRAQVQAVFQLRMQTRRQENTLRGHFAGQEGASLLQVHLPPRARIAVSATHQSRTVP